MYPFTILQQIPKINKSSLKYTAKEAKNTLRFHRSIPEYKETALLSLDCMAKKKGVGAVLVKDESTRFGLKAFKGLGGSYCMFRILCEKLSIDPWLADFSDFADESIRDQCQRFEFITATDGNHGKGVSWAAKLFGCKAHVFMPKGTVEARRQAIEDAGSADAVITEMNYDDTVAYAASLADEKGWILIQDTAWDGYEKYPEWIIKGYLTMAEEILSQTKGMMPTHIFLQAGVGSMAGGIESYFIERSGDREPVVTIVEPTAANCIYQSVQKNDGIPHSLEGDPVTIMAGLNCGTPCKSVWPVLRDCSSFFVSCKDEVTIRGMRGLRYPEGSDPVIISGESGAVTYGLVSYILDHEELKELFKMDQDSVILLINTEGDTDPENYQMIINN